MNPKLKDFEILLQLEDVRPCDFWDNIAKEKWEEIIKLINQSKTKEELHNIYIENYGG